MQQLKSRMREPWENPWRITFTSGYWSGVLKDFLLNLELTEVEGAEARLGVVVAVRVEGQLHAEHAGRGEDRREEALALRHLRPGLHWLAVRRSQFPFTISGRGLLCRQPDREWARRPGPAMCPNGP